MKLNTAMLDRCDFTNLVDIFDLSCAEYAGRIAFSCNGVDLTFAELAEQSTAFAEYLVQDLSLQKGDRLAIQLPNILAYPVAAWACLRAGVTIVNTNPLYTEREVLHQLNDSGAKVLLVFGPMLGATSKYIASSPVRSVVCAGPVAPEVALPEGVTLHDFTQAVSRKISNQEPFATVALDDLAILQYTGGTTGPSKGAMLSHRNLLASAVQATSALEQDDEDEIIIAPMPLYHIYGFTWNLVSNVLTGSRSVLIPNPRDITGLLTTMRGLRFTSFAGVNTLFAGLMAHPDFDSIDFSRLKGSIAGGAALVSSIADEWQRRTGSNIFEGYGLSETAASLSCNTPHNNQLGTVGKAFVGTELKVVDDQGRELATGQSGELLVRGPQVLSGYWNRPDIDAIDSEGWFRTGDIAIMQADGYIKIVDRIKDMILVSGFNVYPNEVEDVLTSHPGVFECAAVAVPDERTGEAVKVFVVRCSSELTEEALRDFSRENLAAYKVPKHIVFVKDLPKSAVGKVLRRELRDGTAAAHNS